MLMNLITSTADRYIYDCFCRFGAEFVREADYNENKLRTALNVSSEHTIKKSGQMRTYIQRAFPVGAEISVQEAKVCSDRYIKDGIKHGTGYNDERTGTICGNRKQQESRSQND